MDHFDILFWTSFISPHSVLRVYVIYSSLRGYLSHNMNSSLK